MDYQVYTEEELETLEVIHDYSKVHNAGKIVSSNIIPFEHKPSADKTLEKKLKDTEEVYDPEFMEIEELELDTGQFYNETVGKCKIYAGA